MSDRAVGCPFRTFTSPRPHARFWQMLFGTMAGMEKRNVPFVAVVDAVNSRRNKS